MNILSSNTFTLIFTKEINIGVFNCKYPHWVEYNSFTFHKTYALVEIFSRLIFIWIHIRVLCGGVHWARCHIRFHLKTVITFSMKTMHPLNIYQLTFSSLIFIKKLWGAEHMHEYPHCITTLHSIVITSIQHIK